MLPRIGVEETILRPLSGVLVSAQAFIRKNIYVEQ